MMIDIALLIAALAAAYAGAAMIALGNPVHWGAVMHMAAPATGVRRRQRLFGAVLIALSIVLTVIRDGWSFGLLLGPLVIGVALALVITTLSLRPRSLRLFAFSGAGKP